MKIRIIIFFLIIFLLFFLGFLWFKEATSAVSLKNNTSKIFVVKKGESIREITKNLKREGLIRDSLAFFVLVKKLGIEKSMQAGDFRLKPSMDAYQIAEELKHGTLDVWITIPEGWRIEEVALKLTKELSIPENEFLKYAKEGYMFPDTYLFPKDASAAAIAETMIENFNKKVKNSLKQKQDKKNLSFDKIITLASLVEKEAKFDEDRKKIASVFLNRLNSKMKLDIDATIQYALGYQVKEKTWWKKGLTKKDMEINSPYNTYKNPGLPPSPIANPGLASIKAVLNPAKTNYFYYLSDKKGRTHFSKTLEEHNKNINRYLK